MEISLKQKGFSLLEMMIVVAIIGILATIAYPSYMHYIERGHLMNAHIELIDINNLIKLKRIKEPSKLRSEAELTEFLKNFNIDPDVSSKYVISIAMPDAKNSIGYNLTAIPKSSSGYKMAVWMNSTGDAYKCEDTDSATKYTTQDKCKKIGT